MTKSDTEDAPHVRSDKGVTNAITGVVGGPAVQAGAIHGGVHVHQAATEIADIVPRQLRPAPAYFTNRRLQMMALDQIVVGDKDPDRPALVVVNGPGGVGKSALALRWLHGAADRYPDGQLYVDLHSEAAEGLMLLGSVLGRFLRALGIPGERVPVDAGEAAALFRSTTASKRVALLVDNASSAEQVRPLLPASISSVVVVTSRSGLGGLVLDGAEFVTLAPLKMSEGLELLGRMVGDPRVSQDPDAATRLVQLCGGFPLALLIAGARLVVRPGWPVARIVHDLGDEQRRLSAMSMENGVSVQGVFDMAYFRLSVMPARAYRWLGLHPGPDFGSDVAAAALGISGDEASELIETLVDACLVEAGDADRYHFHDLVRSHARQCAEREDTYADRIAVVRRIVEHYLCVSAAADRGVTPLEWRLGPAYQRQSGDEPQQHADGVAALDRWETELPNLMAALRAAVEYGFDELVWQLCEAMWSLFLYRKHFSEWMHAYQLGIDAADRCGNQAAKSRMHHHLGLAHHNLRWPDKAVEQGTAALAAARAAQHEIAESEALSLVGMANRALGRHDDAIEVLRQAIDLDRRAGLRRNEALSRRRLGQALTDAGRIDEAIGQLRQAREQAAAVPDILVESNTMVWLADALTRAGHAAEAIDLLTDAWSTLRVSGSSQYRAQVLMVWGEAAEQLDDLATAQNVLAEARDLYTDIGAPHVARVLRTLERVHARSKQRRHRRRC